MTNTTSKRTLWIILAIVTVGLGLASRAFIDHLPATLNVYLGDALYALMIYFVFSAIFVKRSAVSIGIRALLLCYLIELSQLYHVPWIDAVRSTRLGGLILGYGFLWSDIAAYALGTGAGLLIRREVFERLGLYE